MNYKITLTVKEDKEGNFITQSKITNLQGKNLKITPKELMHIPVTLLQAFCNFVKFDGFKLDLNEIKEDAFRIIESELKK